MTLPRTSDSLDEIRILAVMPWWRWAWIPLDLVHTWALPTFRRRTAEKAAQAWAREHGPCILLRRTGLRTFDLAGQIR